MIRSSSIFLYSHDTFGLGHLRRNRKIAAAIRSYNPDTRVTIATGSDAEHRFPAIPGVDTVRLPSVSKLADGSYVSSRANETLDEVLARRSAILVDAIERLEPDIFIADKEPLGLLGELDQTLNRIASSTYRILGLRDVLDEPSKLRAEWSGRGITDRLPGLYDEIWVYGPKWFHEPLGGLDLPADVIENCRYLGFLGMPKREAPALGFDNAAVGSIPYILVTAGGGEDGAGIMRQVLAACERGIRDDRQILLLPGPLMDPTSHEAISSQAKRYPNVHVLDFHADPSGLMRGAAAVVAMCGYNTFCEVLEAGKPALFVPRETPRQEQLIRARRAAELGAASVLRSVEAEDAKLLAKRINALEAAASPATASQKFTFEGLDRISRRVAEIRERQLLEAPVK